VYSEWSYKDKTCLRGCQLHKEVETSKRDRADSLPEVSQVMISQSTVS